MPKKTAKKTAKKASKKSSKKRWDCNLVPTAKQKKAAKKSGKKLAKKTIRVVRKQKGRPKSAKVGGKTRKVSSCKLA